METVMEKRMIAVLIFAAGVACTVYAGSTGLDTDLFQPAWRGQPNTTLQAWSFSTDDTLAYSDVDLNPYGISAAEVIKPDQSGTKWMSENRGYDGVWHITGRDFMRLHVPNAADAESNVSREVWLQITWSANSDNHDPRLIVQTDNDPAADVCEVEATMMDDLSVVNDKDGKGYYQSLYKITLAPNLMREWIYIKPAGNRETVFIDEIVLDTRDVVPEPTSIALIGIAGGLGMLIRRQFYY
jgi:hypothetical protein